MKLRIAALLGLMAACQPETGVAPIEDDPVESAGEASDPGESAEGSGASDVTIDAGLDRDPSEFHSPTEDDPDEYIFDEETVEPLLGLEDVEKGIEEGLFTVLWADPAIMLDEYTRVIETSMSAAISAEDDCPYYYDYYYEDYGYFYWYDSCTSDEDVSFSGYALGYEYSGMTSGYYVYPHYQYLSGTGSVTNADGYELELGGYAYDYEYEYAGYYSYHYGYIVGNFAYDDPAFADTWLAAGLSINVTVSGDHYDDAESPQNTLTFSGSLSGMQGDVNTIVMTDTYIYTASRGSSCELEPSGTISVRDAAGEWYDVQFQGPPYAGASIFPPDCDGCGQVFFRGQQLGEVCPDFSILTDWEDRPW